MQHFLTHKVVSHGHVRYVFFTPTDTAFFMESFAVCNVSHFGDRTKDSLRLSELDRMTKEDYHARYLIFGGDWNLTEHSSDYAADDDFGSSTKVRASMTQFKKAHSLEEVYQPHHTRIKRLQSARLDRFYISNDGPDKCVVCAPVLQLQITHTSLAQA